MAFRLVYTEFWNDPKVMEEMTPEDKYFYLYLLTNPYTNMIGIYRIVKKQMAFDLGYSIESINSLMTRFIENHKLILYNEVTREICIKNYGKYNLNKSGKPMMDCLKKDLSKVKDISFVFILYKHTERKDMKEAIKFFLDSQTQPNFNEMAKTGTFDDACDESPTNPNPNPNQNPNPKPKQQQENTCRNDDDFNILRYAEQRNFILSAIQIEQLQEDVNMYSLEEVKKALEIADNNGKRNYTYMKAILNNRRSGGDKTNGYNKQSSNGQGQHEENYGAGLAEGIGINIDDM
jgi:DnaD/phage-associated family protein